MKVIFLNDCSSYHVGSQAVTDALRRLAVEAGMELIAHVPGGEIEPGQLVLLNGEGTMHHDAPRALQLHAIACRLRDAGARVILLNATVQNLRVDLSVYERIAVRESLSAQFVKATFNGTVDVLPDLAFCHPIPPASRPAPPRHGILFIDSISRKHADMIAQVAAEHGEKMLHLCEWTQSIDALVELMRSRSLVVTGRFHGAVLAMLAGTPVLAMPSNTWKTRGMMQDFGLEWCCHGDLHSLRTAIHQKRWGRAEPNRVASIPGQWRAFMRSLKVAPAALDERKGCPVSPEASCVLVGNGPSVTSARLGRVIDAFEEVVRFNNYQIAGYEPHAGSRTTLWSTFGRDMLPKDSPPPQRIVFIHDNSGNPAVDGQVWRIPHAFYMELRRRIHARSTWPAEKLERVNPSSGCLVAHWLLEAGGVKKVHLIGFDHFAKRQSPKHHYWLPKSFGRPLEHDGDAEAALFKGMFEQGRLRYLA